MRGLLSSNLRLAPTTLVSPEVSPRCNREPPLPGVPSVFPRPPQAPDPGELDAPQKRVSVGALSTAEAGGCGRTFNSGVLSFPLYKSFPSRKAASAGGHTRVYTRASREESEVAEKRCQIAETGMYLR